MSGNTAKFSGMAKRQAGPLDSEMANHQDQNTQTMFPLIFNGITALSPGWNRLPALTIQVHGQEAFLKVPKAGCLSIADPEKYHCK